MILRKKPEVHLKQSSLDDFSIFLSFFLQSNKYKFYFTADVGVIH